MTKALDNLDFYWQVPRDELLTVTAITLFQIAIRYDGVDFDEAKQDIDKEYNIARGRSETKKHGGIFQTYIRAYEEAGWLSRELVGGKKILRVTPAGRQAEMLLAKMPDFLKAAPYFLVELLSRFQLSNPSGPDQTKNLPIKEAIRKSDIFPYWTVWKILRSCDNEITVDELKRFVFRLHRSEDINNVISQIKQYRQDLEQGMSENQLNAKYPLPLGEQSSVRYIMARAGRHIGKTPPLILKADKDIYKLNPAYLPLIDQVISNEPVYKEYLDSETWFRDYGQPVPIEEEYIPFSIPDRDLDAHLDYMKIADDDAIWKQVQDLIAINTKNILFVGPPGTSKTTYALAIGAKLVDNQASRFHNIQFHQSFGYEDFMEGYVPSEGQTNGQTFTFKDKVFKKACDIARKEKDRSVLHVLVIDEINRGDPSRIFGEALTYIERRDELFELSSGRRIFVPSNLLILASMNPYDKSVSDLDQAMDRRFEKIIMKPNAKILRNILVEHNGMNVALAGRITTFFNKLNSEVEGRIGHAYFKDVRDIKTLRMIWNHKILPLIEKELRFNQEKRMRLIQAFKQEFDSPDASET